MYRRAHLLLTFPLSACAGDADKAESVNGKDSGESPSPEETADTEVPTDSVDSAHTGDSAHSGDTSEPAPCERTGVLIYGPTDMAGSTLIEAMGLDVTVWDADQWTAATTEDFATFALIVVGEQSCNGPDTHGELIPLSDTRPAWGPAIDGRVMISGLDLECHITDWEEIATGDETVPPVLYHNAVSWLSETCATNAMFATDWGRRDGEHLTVFGPIDEEPQRGDFVNILAPDHPLFAGIASDGLNNWASTFHTVFLTWPDSFEAVATSDEDAGVILLRPSTLE